ncbi:MAG: zeta toxin family protein [Polyangia bacterium]
MDPASQALGLDARPIVVAIAGPTGAGKSTFFHAHLAQTGLRFVNADDLARELGLDAYAAAELAKSVHRGLVQQRASFVFETVFSDPVGDKVRFLRECQAAGYTVLVCYIALDDAGFSEERVAMRVLQGGHDVPTKKLVARFPRSRENLRLAIAQLPRVLVFDNTDLRRPFHKVGEYADGAPVGSVTRPPWLRRLERKKRAPRS